MDREDPQRGEIWRHIGNERFYKILRLAKDKKSKADLVVYQDIDLKKFPTVWVRTLEDFMSWRTGYGEGKDGWRFERPESSW